jgi:hypothetical protein
MMASTARHPRRLSRANQDSLAAFITCGVHARGAHFAKPGSGELAFQHSHRRVVFAATTGDLSLDVSV